MYRSTRRFCAPCILALSFLLFATGCGQDTTAPTPPAAPVVVVEREPPVPGEMELSDPKVYFRDDEVVNFEVKYRFTKGKPDKFYRCEVYFLDTPNAGMKVMGHSDLQAQGVIKDGVRLHKPPVKAWKIFVAEGPSSRGPWRTITNVLSGEIQK